MGADVEWVVEVGSERVAYAIQNLDSEIISDRPIRIVPDDRPADG